MLPVGLTAHWPSLNDEVVLSSALYGPDSGPRRVADWLDEQLSRIADMSFARSFADDVQLPGVGALDYAHRRIRTARGESLGGIRFYGRNVDRPFVDVMAHSFDDIAALAHCVRAEWSNFAVRFLRLRTKPTLLAEQPNVLLDTTIHLARYRDMNLADDRVTLERFDTVDHAFALVADRYSGLVDSHRVLSDNLSPAEPDEIRAWHHNDQLRAIRLRDETIGLLAVAPGAIGWIAGDVINEEVIAAAHTGSGYAASAQCAWARDVALDAEQLLIGTIDRHNHASRATAVRAGRPRVLDDVFVELS